MQACSKRDVRDRLTADNAARRDISLEIRLRRSAAKSMISADAFWSLVMRASTHWTNVVRVERPLVDALPGCVVVLNDAGR